MTEIPKNTKHKWTIIVRGIWLCERCNAVKYIDDPGRAQRFPRTVYVRSTPRGIEKSFGAGPCEVPRP